MLSILEEHGQLSPYAKLALGAGLYAVKVIAILILGYIAAAVVKRLIRRLTASWRERGDERRADTLSAVLTSLSQYTIGFIAVCAVLGVFNIPMTSVLAVAGVGSVALGFGAQSLVKDIITGFFILLEDQFGVGDLVTLAGKTGTVEAIGMRTTRVRGFDGELYILPNSQILFVTNLSGSYRNAVVDVHADVSALGAVSDEMRAVKDRLQELFISEPAVLVVDETDGKRIRIIAGCRVGESAAVEHEIARSVKERLDREKIGYAIRGENS